MSRTRTTWDSTTARALAEALEVTGTTLDDAFEADVRAATDLLIPPDGVQCLPAPRPAGR